MVLWAGDLPNASVQVVGRYERGDPDESEAASSVGEACCCRGDDCNTRGRARVRTRVLAAQFNSVQLVVNIINLLIKIYINHIITQSLLS